MIEKKKNLPREMNYLSQLFGTLLFLGERERCKVSARARRLLLLYFFFLTPPSKSEDRKSSGSLFAFK